MCCHYIRLLCSRLFWYKTFRFLYNDVSFIRAANNFSASSNQTLYFDNLITARKKITIKIKLKK